MASTVLGKRSRAQETVGLTRAERAKRRAIGCSVGVDRRRPIAVLEDVDDCAPILIDPIKQNFVAEVAVENVQPVTQNSFKQSTRPNATLVSHFKTTKQVEDVDSENKKPGQPHTPSSDRHYNALVATPKHRADLVTKPATPRTPQSQRGSRFTTGPSIFQEARKLFTRSANAGALIGRNAERHELHTFLSERVEKKQNGCIYVSGPPGTGKSAFVTDICRNVAGNTSAKYAYANCMSMQNAADTYTELLCAFDSDFNPLASDARKALLQMATDTTASDSLVVVLDEIDQLLNMDVSVLYTLFEMSFLRNSRMILVGIANALDLTDRFLPRLKARNLKPRLLPFLPYTAPQIASVLSARCRLLLPKDSKADTAFTPLLMNPAITLISKKVAAQTGDLRKAFDIAQKVIDVLEAETREKLSRQAQSPEMAQASPSRAPLAENPNLSSPAQVSPKAEVASPSQMLGELKAENAPRATLAHVVRVTAAAFGNGTSQRLKGLNLQQKAILCSLFALEQKKRAETMQATTPSRTGRGGATPTRSNSTSPTMRALFEAYSALCTRDNILHALSSTEFRDVVGNLETLSLISPVDGRSGSFAMPCTPSRRGRNAAFCGAVKADDRRVTASVTLQELDAAVQGIGSGILKAMLTSHTGLT